MYVFVIQVYACVCGNQVCGGTTCGHPTQCGDGRRIQRGRHHHEAHGKWGLRLIGGGVDGQHIQRIRSQRSVNGRCGAGANH